MSKFFDENGNEVEGFTEEELKDKQKEAVDAYVSENPSKNEELDKAEKDLEEANTKLKEFEEGDENNKGQKDRLIKGKKDAEKTLEGVVENFTKQIDDLKTGFLSGAKSKIIGKLAGGDEELQKKIEKEYDDYNEGKPAPANDVEVQDRLTKAYTLATGNLPTPNFMDGVSGAGSKGDSVNGGAGNQQEPETDNSKSIRKALEISDEDVKKFTPTTEV